jgi:hypothetical protein
MFKPKIKIGMCCCFSARQPALRRKSKLWLAQNQVGRRVYPQTVVSLRNVNMDIRKMLPMLLVKELYDKKKKDNNKSHSLHIIVDEAHNILSKRR